MTTVFKNNGYNVQEFVYDYSIHGGGTTAINLGYLPIGAIVEDVVAWVETAITSTGSATVAWGNDTADGYSGTTIAKATLVKDYVMNAASNDASLLWDGTNDHVIPYRISSTATSAFNVKIGTEVLNGGRIVFMVKYLMPA